MSKIQKQDVKTLAQLTGAGASASDLINDTQIYVTADGINKQLSQAITDGDIGTGGGGGGGGGSGTEFGDIYQQLNEEELQSLSSKVPNQIIDAFNDNSRGDKVDMAASGDALRIDAGETEGSYTRKLAASISCSTVNGIAVHSVQRLAPKSGQTVPMDDSSQDIIFSGDVTEFFPVNKKITLAKLLADSDDYADGFNRYQFLNNGDKILELEVTAVSFDSGQDETTITVSNAGTVDLAMGIVTGDLNSKMSVFPWDYQYQVKSNSAASLETMDVTDAFLEDVIRIPGENFFSELFSITGSIRSHSAQLSPSKEYGVVKLGEWNGTHVIWHFGYSADYGKSWTKFGTTKSSLSAEDEETGGNFIRNTPDSLAVDDQGNAFWTYYFVSTNIRIGGVYSDLTIGTPVLTDTVGTGADSATTAVNGAGIIAAISGNSVYGASVAILDGYVAVVIGNGSTSVVWVRWYSAGGATHVGLSSTSYSHDINNRPFNIHISNVSPNRRTHLFRRNDADGHFYHVYWDEGSTTAVANSLVINSAINIIGSSVSGNRAVVLFIGSGNSVTSVTGTIDGTPSWGSLKDLFNGTTSLIVDLFNGWNTETGVNYNKVKKSNIAQNLADPEHCFITLDTNHPDSVRRSTLIEIPDVSTANFAALTQFASSGFFDLRSSVSNQERGQSFTATASTPNLRTFSVLLHQTGFIASGNTLQADIYAVSAGIPTGASLGTSQLIDPSKITKSTSGQWVHFNFDSVALANGTQYVVMVSSTFAINGSDYLRISLNTSNPYASGTLVNNDTGVYSADSGTDCVFMISDAWVSNAGKAIQNDANKANFGFDDQESQVAQIDSNSVQYSFRRIFNNTVAAYRQLSGHPFRRVLTWGNGSVQSVMTDAVVAGYAPSNFDENLVFSTALGTDECKRQNISTGVLDDNSAAEDRSGALIVNDGYNNITSADTVVDSDFESGVAIDFDGSTERLTYVDRPEFDLYFNKPFIIEMEVKFTSLPVGGDIINQYGAANLYGWQFNINSASGDLDFLISNSSGTTIGRARTNTAFVTTAQYYKLRVVYDGLGGAPKIFKATTVNGSFTEATYAISTAFASGNTSSTAGLFIASRSGFNGTLPARISYVKISNGASTFAYEGFKNQAPLVGHLNLGTKILSENKVGTNSTTSGTNFDNAGIISDANDASVVDSHDVIAQFNHSIAGTAGNELELKINAGKGSDRNVSSIQGINFRFSK